MDLTESIIPRSDQINADDLIAGPITVTITDAYPGGAEQPVDITLAETPGRAYRPSKSMRRVLVAAWGKQSSAYVGRRLTLYRNPDITFGSAKVGGIEISHMSHIDKPLTLALTRARGKRTPFTVQPLAEPVARDWKSEADDLAAVVRVDALYALHAEAKASGATPDDLAHIIKRGREAKAAVEAAKAEEVES